MIITLFMLLGSHAQAQVVDYTLLSSPAYNYMKESLAREHCAKQGALYDNSNDRCACLGSWDPAKNKELGTWDESVDKESDLSIPISFKHLPESETDFCGKAARAASQKGNYRKVLEKQAQKFCEAHDANAVVSKSAEVNTNAPPSQWTSPDAIGYECECVADPTKKFKLSKLNEVYWENGIGQKDAMGRLCPKIELEEIVDADAEKKKDEKKEKAVKEAKLAATVIMEVKLDQKYQKECDKVGAKYVAPAFKGGKGVCQCPGTDVNIKPDSGKSCTDIFFASFPALCKKQNGNVISDGSGEPRCYCSVTNKFIDLKYDPKSCTEYAAKTEDSDNENSKPDAVVYPKAKSHGVDSTGNYVY